MNIAARIRSNGILVLKGVNFLLTTAWAFGLVFVLSRTMSIADFATIAVVSNLGNYLLLADLGLSSVIYVQLRKGFIEGAAGPAANQATAALLAYVALAVVASGLFAVVAHALKVGSPEIRVALTIYFISAAAALPWMMVRVSCNAIDRFVHIESIEFVRRLVSIGLIAGMLGGMSFIEYALANVALWAAAFTAAAVLLKGLRRGVDILDGFRRMRSELHSITGASRFMLSEFFIYNFLYLFLPVKYGNPVVVLAFDAFYRITRFGVSAYGVVCESLLPRQTRALHTGDSRWLLRVTGMVYALAALPMIVGVLAVTVLGDQIFGLLYHNPDLVPPQVRICMAIMLFFLFLQAPAGTLMLFTGKSVQIARVAVAMGAIMASLAVIAFVSDMTFAHLLLCYVLLFAGGALTYLAMMVRNLQRFRKLGGAW
jgi:O-antigen/teichoic acid export membrane protein